MKRNIVRITFLIVFAANLVGASASAYAQQCSLGGAVGKYGFSDSGSIVGVGARAAVGLLTFSASGKMQGTVTASLGGAIGTTTLEGIYKVNPDCSGTASFSEFDPQTKDLILTATVAITWDANMQEARFLFTSIVLANGTALSPVVNGDARKLVLIGQ